MVEHLLDKIGSVDSVILVVSPCFNLANTTTILSTGHRFHDNVIVVQQACPMGTGDAFRTALGALPENISTVIVLNGDGPAVPIQYIRDLAETERSSSVILARRAHLPFAQAMGKYHVDTRTIEENPETRHPDDLVNTGVYIFRNDDLSADLVDVVAKLPLHEPSRLGGQSEYYLTDLLGLISIEARIVDDRDIAVRFQGINTLEEYKYVDSLLCDGC